MSQVFNGKTKARVSPIGGDNTNNRRESRNDSNCPTVIMRCVPATKWRPRKTH